MFSLTKPNIYLILYKDTYYDGLSVRNGWMRSSFLKIQKNGYRISYGYNFIPIDEIEPLRLKIFQELFLYHMEKTKFKMNVVEIDEMLLLNYDDLIAYITVQKMADI